MGTARPVSTTFRCLWCKQVWAGRTWQLERRRPARARYVLGVCQRCEAKHCFASRDRARVLVERCSQRF